MRKRMSFILSCFLMLQVLAGCSTSETTGTNKPNDQASQPVQPTGKEMVLNWNADGGEPPTADPGLASDGTSFDVITACFEGLTRYGPDGKIGNAIADSYTVSEDLTTYTFKLKSNALWSNGDSVTAHDFEFAWKRNLDPKTASEYAYMLYFIKGAEEFNTGKGSHEDVGVKAIDDFTLEVKLNSPAPFFYELTAFPTLFPLHKKTLEAQPDWAASPDNYVGNGPFKMELWEHKNKLVLVKNEKYHDKNAVKLDKIVWSMITDTNTAQALFDSGDLDWGGHPSYVLPVDVIPALQEEGKIVMAPYPNTVAVTFNTTKPPFTNKKIRQAFSYSIQRQPLVDGIVQTGVPAAFAWVPPSMQLSGNDYFKEDVDKAKQLLAEGLKELGLSTMPEVTYTYGSGDDRQKKLAEALQDQWKRSLGVDVKISGLEEKVFLQNKRSKNYQFAYRNWGADFNDPINFLEIFKDKTVGTNDAAWENDRYRELIVQSYLEKDPTKRNAIMREAETILMEETPIAPVYYGARPYIRNDKVKGFLINPFGGRDFKYTTIEQ
ncbi:peptide ABC transporter substrate-binding protein [Brevibacillus antibioticus]|uniref:Peptide ABC transporter substrate-binding protein n=1 Tax=Brevibacillus antibioticus TaxID=2570228 RepID=A0A4U2Y3V4_9BACL|nr:peptide ABC transporter substrate-binding protein [Brevibacillus antibioticus]TKI55170.1 peptide ABC transporter substrate-binding protein [Brevibacillus antibioticus]